MANKQQIRRQQIPAVHVCPVSALAKGGGPLLDGGGLNLPQSNRRLDGDRYNEQITAARSCPVSALAKGGGPSLDGGGFDLSRPSRRADGDRHNEQITAARARSVSALAKGGGPSLDGGGFDLSRPRRRAVFFDRDGTLNVDTHYLYRPEDFRWMPGAVDAIKYCNEHGWLVIVITNQSGVARGYYTEADVQRLHDWMNAELGKAGAHIDAFYYCPHHEQGTVPAYTKKCDCRKPSPKLVNDACRDFGIDKEQSFLIGDAERDMQCAANAGVKGWLYTGGSLLDMVMRGITAVEI